MCWRTQHGAPARRRPRYQGPTLATGTFVALRHRFRLAVGAGVRSASERGRTRVLDAGTPLRRGCRYRPQAPGPGSQAPGTIGRTNRRTHAARGSPVTYTTPVAYMAHTLAGAALLVAALAAPAAAFAAQPVV